MKNKILIGILLVLILGGAVYWVMNPDSLKNNNEMSVGQNPAEESARNDLAQKLNVSTELITIVNTTNATWGDGCLGLGGPAESCLAALVEGFKIELKAQGHTYIYRTDKTGSAVRLETQ